LTQLSQSPKQAMTTSSLVMPSTAERCVSTARGVVFSTVLLLQLVDRGVQGRLPAAMAALTVLAIGYVLTTSALSVVGREDARLRLPLLVVDVLLVSGLIEVSHSAQSELYLLFYIPILQAGVRLTLRDAIASAVLAALMYGLIIISNGPAGQVVTSTSVRSVAFAGSAVVLAVVLGLLKHDVDKRLARQELLTKLAEAICMRAEVAAPEASGPSGKAESRGVSGPFGASFRFVAETPRSILQMIGASLGATHRLMHVPPDAHGQGFWVVSAPKDDPTTTIARQLAEKVVQDDLSDGKAVVIERVSREPELAEFASAVKTALVLPVYLGTRHVATIVLCGKEPTVVSPERVYSTNDLRMACALAPQAALLLDYARVQHGVHLMLRRVVGTLAAAIDAKDPDTRGHSSRVAHYARFLARAVGLSEEWVDAVELGALLHDVGKIGMDDALLQGVVALGAEEWDLVRQHPSIGRAIFANLDELGFLLPALECHHERFDGTGYPRGLAGRQVPMLARIVAVADAFDAMTSPRRYRPAAMSFEEALAEIERGAGGQFDPELARLFVRYATPELIREAHATVPERISQAPVEGQTPSTTAEAALATV
jgi:HD-GYP domain-containing protein (c-di-GMP phosphodiesterase class II)